MARPKLVVIHPEQSDQSRASRDGKKYRLELSRKRLIVYLSCFGAALCWMFILGLLVGRGIALVSSEDISVRAEFMRFMGLGRQADQPAPKAAETWEEPRKILESLNYYQDLTRKEASPGAMVAPIKPDAEELQSTAPNPDLDDNVSPVPPVIPAEPAKEPTGKPSRAPAQPSSEKAPAVEPEKTARAAPAEPEKSARPAASQPVFPGEHFTLLVSSLQDPENAQRLIERLKAKGYSPRLETLDLNGRWNRVLVGSFQSRDAALKFAAEFNKKESMEGLVIRESNQGGE